MENKPDFFQILDKTDPRRRRHGVFQTFFIQILF
jgi:hypothetical protein